MTSRKEKGHHAVSNGDAGPTLGSRKPRVLFIVPGAIERRTGGSIYNRHLFESFTRNGFLLHIVSVPDLPYAVALVAGILISPWLLLKTLRLKPDLVIEDAWAHPQLFLFNLLFTSRADSRLVLIAHLVRWSADMQGRRLARKIEAATLRRAQLVVAVSRFVMQEVRRLAGARPQIVIARPGSDGVEDGVSVDRVAPRAVAGELRLLFAGSCVREKGVEDLINALALVSDLPLLLDLAGRDDIEPRFIRKLKRKINLSGLVERVRFHGLVDSVTLARFYHSADIFVFPSHHEGYGIVLAEAMRAGLPIVAAENGPVAEILRHNENALVVPARNPRALAAAIRKLAEDPVTRQRFGGRSRELAASLPMWRDTCNLVLEAIHHLDRGPLRPLSDD